MQIDVATVESSMEIPQKIKNGSTFWPRDLTSQSLSEETQNSNLREHEHPYVHCSLIYNLQDQEAAQMSISRWVDKTTLGHLHNEVLLGCGKKKILPFVTAWMDLENIMLSELSQSQKHKYHRITPICGI